MYDRNTASNTSAIVPSDSAPLRVAIEDVSSAAGQTFLAGNDRDFVFPFVDLDQGISESSMPEYASTHALGRAEQFKTYAGSANREIPLVFNFHAQGLRTKDPNVACDDEVVRPSLWLSNLTLPILAADVWYPPPVVILIIGSMLSMRCVVSAVSIQWMGPWETLTLAPHRSMVYVTFTSVASALGNMNSSNGQFRNQVPTFSQTSLSRRQ